MLTSPYCYFFLWLSFRDHSHESVQKFIENRVQDLKRVGRGRLEDTEHSNISAAPPVNDSHAGLEINMLENILVSIPVPNGE